MLVHVYAHGTLVYNIKFKKDLHSMLTSAGVVTNLLIVLKEERVTTYLNLYGRNILLDFFRRCLLSSTLHL